MVKATRSQNLNLSFLPFLTNNFSAFVVVVAFVVFFGLHYLIVNKEMLVRAWRRA